ncbi:hypothetical protein D5F01_LYC24404 [Larimichthys crocea]|uniref:Uncharacterized protein n=1 Tax=Larimichthys crocea TaxID=215358 RepID=A0A6G0HF42_LARCR|nr:hypothetical protein D5F01_LYC24404 [Larimichthys crocea]
MAHVPPSSLHTSLGSWAPQSLSPPGGQRGLIILTLHTHAHKHTQRNQEEGPDMAHVPPSSLHTSLGNLGSTEPLSSWRSEGPDHTHTTHARTSIHRGTRRRALTWLTSHPAACTHPWAELGSTEPLSSWRSEGPDHTHTTHARTHKHTQRNQEEGPDMAHVPPSSLHTSLGKLGSTEPLSSWRSEGPDHTHTTHARTHKHTQRNQEEGPDMAHVPPSSLHTSLGRAGLHRALSSWRSEGPDHTHTTHARTQAYTEEPGPHPPTPPSQHLSSSLINLLTTHTPHRGTRRRALTWLTSHPAACTHPWAELGSTEPLFLGVRGA